MGAYLSQPNTTKTSSDGGNSNLSFGFSAMQGWRVSMEVRRKIICIAFFFLSFFFWMEGIESTSWVNSGINKCVVFLCVGLFGLRVNWKFCHDNPFHFVKTKIWYHIIACIKNSHQIVTKNSLVTKLLVFRLKCSVNRYSHKFCQ